MVKNTISQNPEINQTDENISLIRNRYHKAISDFIDKKTLQQRKERGVLCFSGRNDHVLLWSHYADSHKGICLAYDESIFPPEKIHEVTYSPVPPQLSLDINGEINIDKWVYDWISTKYDVWRYEDEYRIIHSSANQKYFIPPNGIKAVYFGIHTPKDDADTVARALLIHHKDISFFKANSQNDEYKISFTQINFHD